MSQENAFPFSSGFVKSWNRHLLVININASDATAQTAEDGRLGVTIVPAPDAASWPRLPALTMFGLTQPTRESAQGVAGAWPPFAVMVVLLDQNASTKGIERDSMPSWTAKAVSLGA